MIKICPNCRQTFLKRRKDQIYCCIRCKQLFGLRKRYKLRCDLGIKKIGKREYRYNSGYKYQNKIYRLTLNQYNILLDKQNGCCAICCIHHSKFNRKFAIDHNHITGKIRELLCGKCNSAIGLLHDDAIIVRKAVEYLDKHNQES